MHAMHIHATLPRDVLRAVDRARAYISPEKKARNDRDLNLYISPEKKARNDRDLNSSRATARTHPYH